MHLQPSDALGPCLFPRHSFMTEEHWDWQHEWTIPSRAGASRCVEEEIIHHLEDQHWSARDVFSVRLALEEALVNAIKHGNHFDGTKSVQVACQLSSGRLRIAIADEGDGFEPGDVPDPTDPAFIDRPSGRGIMLMRTFMTRVDFNARGNQVILEKVRPHDGEPEQG